MNKDLTGKVVVVGDISVGKTSLLLQFADGKFRKFPIITIGNDFKQRTVRVDDKLVKLQIWDTAGQERHKSLTDTFFRGSHGVILMFDVTNMTSFLRIQNWLNDLNFHKISNECCLLVGNKTDLSNERVVGNSQAQALANRLGMLYMETSAKEDFNVQHVFNTLAKQMVSKAKLSNETSLSRQESMSCTLHVSSNNNPALKKEGKSCRC